jgi:hypothetical protein
MTLKYELTKDPTLLEQYYRIREMCFRRELGIEDFDGSEDARDRRSHILIARVGNRCIGGTRITGRHPGSLHPVPVEEEGLDLVAELPGLRLAESSFCQWGRLALDPAYRTPDVLRRYCNAMIDASRALGYTLSLVVTDINRARLYKRLFYVLGYRYDIVHDVRIPAEAGFDGLPHLLAVGYHDAACFSRDAHLPLHAVA